MTDRKTEGIDGLLGVPQSIELWERDLSFWEDAGPALEYGTGPWETDLKGLYIVESSAVFDSVGPNDEPWQGPMPFADVPDEDLN